MSPLAKVISFDEVVIRESKFSLQRIIDPKGNKVAIFSENQPGKETDSTTFNETEELALKALLTIKK